jgi:hypothetical protein
LVSFGKAGVKRETQQTIAYIFCHRAIAILASQVPSHIRKVKRQVMKDAVDI